MKPSPAFFGDVFELCITLCDIQPAIWRRVRIPADVTLGELHEVFQVAFGWTNSHLHDVFVANIRFGMVDEENDMFAVDEKLAAISKRLGRQRK